MAAPDHDTQSLIRRLIAGTKIGRVPWDALSPTAFEVATTSAKINLYSEDQDDNHPFVIKVSNSDGLVVGSGKTQPGQPYAPWEQDIANLWHLARNTALGVTSTISSVAAELDLPDDPDADIPF
jgi:hypothetical protein